MWKSQGLVRVRETVTTKDGHCYNSCALENNKTAVLVPNYPTLELHVS